MRDMEVRLEEAEGRSFHRSTARLLFLCKRPRPDIQNAVALLTTRVKELTYKDGKKLLRVLAYLKVRSEEF